jgi:hypothetical protein
MSNSLIAMFLLSMLAVSLTMDSADIPAQDTDRNQFTIGILRGDSVIIPFGEYRDGKWLARWPKPDGFGEDIDNSLADLPDAWFDRNKGLSTTWYYRSSSDVATLIKASKIIKVQNHCQENWAVLCDFPGQALKAGELHRNVGVALDIDKWIDNPIEIINSSKERRRITSFIRPAFDKSEGIKPPGIDSLEPFVHYPSSAERRKARLIISRLYRNREPIDGQRIYYVEAKKEYKNPFFSKTDPSCNTISFFKGWVVQNKRGGLGLIDSRYILSDCDMKATTLTKLLGILPMRDRIFFITEDHGYESESYRILELKGSRIKQVLKVYGGAC